MFLSTFIQPVLRKIQLTQKYQWESEHCGTGRVNGFVCNPLLCRSKSGKVVSEGTKPSFKPDQLVKNKVLVQTASGWASKKDLGGPRALGAAPGTEFSTLGDNWGPLSCRLWEYQIRKRNKVLVIKLHMDNCKPQRVLESWQWRDSNWAIGVLYRCRYPDWATLNLWGLLGVVCLTETLVPPELLWTQNMGKNSVVGSTGIFCR